MDALEAALKHCLEWSLGSRQKGRNEPSEYDEHFRAFLTHFKIKLNELIGSKSFVDKPENSQTLSDYTTNVTMDETVNSLTTTIEDDELDGASSRGYKAIERGPAIKMRGKYSGVYQIGREEELEESDEQDDTYNSELRAEMAKCSLGGAQVELDDGYRSLSRASANLPLRCRTLRAKAGLLQQLNDIKSRVVDLVDEIDQCIDQRIAKDEILAYQRRRDALLKKLDHLIESQRFVNPWPTEQPDEEKQNDESSASNLDDGYEEQIQVIDYDFARRASDLVEIRSKSSASSSADSQSLGKVGPSAKLLILQSSARPSEHGKQAKLEKMALEKVTDATGDLAQRIDIPTGKNHNHLTSSSSTSTYSTLSTHTTSSSSSFI